jgi:hypothetical protein
MFIIIFKKLNYFCGLYLTHSPEKHGGAPCRGLRNRVRKAIHGWKSRRRRDYDPADAKDSRRSTP